MKDQTEEQKAAGRLADAVERCAALGEEMSRIDPENSLLATEFWLLSDLLLECGRACDAGQMRFETVLRLGELAVAIQEECVEERKRQLRGARVN